MFSCMVVKRFAESYGDADIGCNSFALRRLFRPVWSFDKTNIVLVFH